MLLLYLALAYMTGISLGRFAWENSLLGCATPPWLWLLPTGLLLLTPLLDRLHRLRSRHSMRWPASAGFILPPTGIALPLGAAMLLCICIGALRYAAQPNTPCWTSADLASYNLPADSAFDAEAPQVALTGYISDYPTIENTRQRLQVTVDTLFVDGAPQVVRGILLLTTGSLERYQYGQPVKLRGRLVTPPVFDTFSYRDYLARKGVHSLLYSPQVEVMNGSWQGSWLRRQLYALRARGEAVLNRSLPEPYAALANGILLGIDAGIPDELYDKFNLTGTSHVVVISGSNVAIIVAALMALFQRLLGRRPALYFTLVGIGCYALLVGGDAAVLRAALMGGLVVVAAALQRRSSALVSLAAACGAITLINPAMLWDVGFQLSSMATASLILFTPGITAFLARFWSGFRGGFLTGDPLPSRSDVGGTAVATTLVQGLLADGLVATLAANVLVLPLIVHYFGRLSLISLLTNLVIVPVQPLILLWGSVGVLIGAVGVPGLTQLTLWVAWLGLYWTVQAVELSARLPGASVEVASFGVTALVATYAAIFALRWREWVKDGLARAAVWARGDWRSQLLQPVSLGALGIVALLLWRVVLSLPDGRLHVRFLDIGQGDGILVQTPSGRQLLIDGGNDPQRLFGQLGKALPFWDRSLDMLVLTHPDGDHMNAQMEVPPRYNVGQALDTVISQANPDAEPWRAILARNDVSVHLQHTGGWVDLGDGVALWVLWPPPGGFDAESADNENSLVMKLVYGDFSVLLTGDAGLVSEDAWLGMNLPLATTVLKVGHHGSAGSTGVDFLAAVNPQVAVIQVGSENKYGHPTDEALARLDGRLLLRNDQHGSIHIASDGHLMWIETERQTPVLDWNAGWR
jgi:competence protein ComEC